MGNGEQPRIVLPPDPTFQEKRDVVSWLLAKMGAESAAYLVGKLADERAERPTRTVLKLHRSNEN